MIPIVQSLTLSPPSPSRGGASAPPLYGALDLGTNNCRLLIAAPSGAGVRVVDSFSRIVRLGEGLAATGRLGEAAVARTVAALGVCADRLAAHRIQAARLVATEACRSAANGLEFVERVERETGLALEIIDREEEARLAAIGCADLLAPDAEGGLVVDIGGGSTELSFVRPASTPDGVEVVDWTSLPVGVVTLSETAGGRQVDGARYAAMREATASLVAPFAERTRRLATARGFHVIGSSGTVTTAAAVHLRLPRYDRRRVDGLWLERGDVEAVVAALLRLDHAGRAANACIGPDRADLVLPGCAILEAVVQAFPSERLRVGDRGLREGMLLGLMRADGALAASPEVRP